MFFYGDVTSAAFQANQSYQCFPSMIKRVLNNVEGIRARKSAKPDNRHIPCVINVPRSLCKRNHRFIITRGNIDAPSIIDTNVISYLAVIYDSHRRELFAFSVAHSDNI